MAENQSENAIIAQEMKTLLEGHPVALFDPTGQPSKMALDIPSGRTLRTLKGLQDEYRTFPERRKGTVRLLSVDSFVEIVERFKNPDSVIFADTTQASPRLLAVFDYHPRGGVGGVEPSKLPSVLGGSDLLTAGALAKVGTDAPSAPAIVWPAQLGLEGSARHGEHRALYEFPKSEEWTEWNTQNEKWMTQDEFAQFIEDNVLAVGSPEKALTRATEVANALTLTYCTAQKLMTLSRGLKLTANIEYEQEANLQSGEATLHFKEEHLGEGGVKVNVPGGFLINIPIFTGAQPWQLVARLKYRRNNSKSISWQYSLYRMDQAFEAAIKSEAQRVRNLTGLPVLLGKPGGKQQDE